MSADEKPSSLNSYPLKVDWSGRGLKYERAEIDAVVEAMTNAATLTQGAYQTAFEAACREYSGAHHAFAVSSATAALELAATVLRLQPGDEVVVPAHTFCASVIPFARRGATIVWADINPKTWVVTAETMSRCITARTRAIVPVHLYGLVCDMDPIMDLAQRNGVAVVEDAAQAIGARYRDKMAGTIGDLGCYSFHSHKNMSLLGEGGMLTVRNSQWASLIPGLRHNGLRSFPGERTDYWVPAMSNVDFDIEGVWPHNFCIGEVQCALGIQLLRRIDRINAERTARARRARDVLAGVPELVFQEQPEHCGHSHHLLPLRYDGSRHGRTRDDLIRTLFYQYGVKAVVQYYPLYRYPLFQRAGFGSADCPNTDDFFDNMLSLPFQHWMTADEFEYMLSAVVQAANQLRSGSGLL